MRALRLYRRGLSRVDVSGWNISSHLGQSNDDKIIEKIHPLCLFAPILEVGMARSAQQIEESRAKMQRLGRRLSMLFTGLVGLSFVCAVVATIVAVMRILSGASFDSSGIVPIIAAPMHLVIWGAGALTLRGICKDMARGDSPFTTAHARRISLFGGLLVAVATIELVASPGFIALTVGRFVFISSTQCILEDLALPVDVGAILGAVSCFSISAIWRYGALLQEQAEDLV